MSLIKFILPFICIAVVNSSSSSSVQQKVYRLPNTISPVSYDLKIDTDFDNFTFSGTVQIAIHVKFTTGRVILHSKNLIVDDLQLTSNNGTRIHQTYDFDTANSLLIIECAEKLIYNTDYLLFIQFRGTLNNKKNWYYRGYYRTSYRLGREKRWLAITQFEPTYAREAFPCFDEPRFRAPFTISLAHSKDHVAISNMPSEEVLPIESSNGTRVWEKFQPTPHLPTYLIAYMISDYKSISSDDGRVRVFARPNAIDQCAFALEQGIRVLDHLEGYTGIKFKSPKLDIVAVPEFEAGAMENWGLTTYREQYVILSRDDSKNRHEITRVIAHEFAHQWFGDLVTPSWYNYLWLKEGFATYFEIFAPAALESTNNSDSYFVTETLSMALMSEPETQRAMTTSIQEFDEIKRIYDLITYQKGGSVIRMMEHAVTSDTFQAALHNFLKDGAEKQDGVVTQQDLFDAFDRQVERDALCKLPKKLSISNFMKTWTENVGYPLIVVIRSYDTGVITISQTTYKLPDMEADQLRQKWIVPLTYTTKSESQFSNTKPTLWSFADTPITLQDSVEDSDWILFNIQYTGYYRVNYDDKNWHLIVRQLYQDKDQIHPLNRAQLLSDSINLFVDDLLDFAIVQNVWGYLENETDLIPWYSAALGFYSISSRISKSRFTTIKDFVHNLIQLPAKSIGYAVKSTDSMYVKSLKSKFLMFACKVGNEECVKRSLDEYEKNKNNITEVQPELQEVVYCNALRHFKDVEGVFDNLWNAYTTTNNGYAKTRILNVLLSCGQNDEIIRKLLTKIANPKNDEIPKSDAFKILKESYPEAPVITATIKFVDEQISKTSNLTDENISLLNNLLRSIESKVNTSEQIELLKKLEAKSKEFHQKHGQLNDIIKKLYAKANRKYPDNLSLAERLKNSFGILHKSPSGQS